MREGAGDREGQIDKNVDKDKYKCKNCKNTHVGQERVITELHLSMLGMK